MLGAGALDAEFLRGPQQAIVMPDLYDAGPLQLLLGEKRELSHLQDACALEVRHVLRELQLSEPGLHRSRDGRVDPSPTGGVIRLLSGLRTACRTATSSGAPAVADALIDAPQGRIAGMATGHGSLG